MKPFGGRESTNIEVIPGPPPRHMEYVPDGHGGVLLVDIGRIRFAAKQLDSVREHLIKARQALLAAGLPAESFGALPTAHRFDLAHARRQVMAADESAVMIRALDRMQDQLFDAANKFQAREEHAVDELKRKISDFVDTMRSS